MKLRLSACAALAALLTAGLAHAQNGIDPNAPLAFSADQSGEFNNQTCTIRLVGRVEITQDRARLRSDSVTMRNNGRSGDCGRQVARVQAAGNVFFVTPDQTVKADNADYDVSGKTMVFTGNVIVVQGQNVSTADRLEYNTDSGSGALSGHVRGVIYPDQASGPAQ